jgi:peptidoglycan hydrolase-like protein with peptidoglycan-binding domain
MVLAAAPVRSAHAADYSAVLARMDAIIKEMNALREEFQTLSATLPSSPSGEVLGAHDSKIFTHSLEVGETNDDIGRIQKLLATDPEIYPEGTISGFFGPKTVEAVRAFQSRFGLDPVGVVGPATKALLEAFFTAYPDGTYPAGVLDKKPVIPSTPKPTTGGDSSTPTPSGSNPLLSIDASSYYGEVTAKVTFANGTRRTVIVTDGSDASIAKQIAAKLGIAASYVTPLLSVESAEKPEKQLADDEIDYIVASVANGEAKVKVKYGNGDHDSFTIDKDKESQIIKETAKELDLDESDVEDVIEFSYEDVAEINVDVEGGKATAMVTFEDGTEKRIKIDSDSKNAITKELAKELDEDEDDVKDWTKFDFLD